ncbi:MAG: c-type cytochrome [Acidobacteriaceae bacterium]
MTRKTTIGMGAVGVIVMMAGGYIAARNMMSIPVHHLVHAVMALGAGMLALAMAERLPPRSTERSLWVLPATLAPIFGLFLMWPSEYAYLMAHPALHLLDHAGIIGLSCLAVYAAQAYVRGLGWPMLILLVAMNATAAGGFGVAPAPSALLDLPLSTLTAQGPAPSMHVAGQQVSESLGCEKCHRVDGGKSIGPTWKNLAGYPQKLSDGTSQIANYEFLKTAILDPEHLELDGFPHHEMPTTYAGMLSGPAHADEHDLNAIIWYINSLSDRSTPASQPPVPDKPPKK